MWRIIIAFVIGVFVGAPIGMILTALVSANQRGEDDGV